MEANELAIANSKKFFDVVVQCKSFKKNDVNRVIDHYRERKKINIDHYTFDTYNDLSVKIRDFCCNCVCKKETIIYEEYDHFYTLYLEKDMNRIKLFHLDSLGVAPRKNIQNILGLFLRWGHDMDIKHSSVVMQNDRVNCYIFSIYNVIQINKMDRNGDSLCRFIEQNVKADGSGSVDRLPPNFEIAVQSRIHMESYVKHGGMSQEQLTKFTKKIKKYEVHSNSGKLQNGLMDHKREKYFKIAMSDLLCPNKL